MHNNCAHLFCTTPNPLPGTRVYAVSPRITQVATCAEREKPAYTRVSDETADGREMEGGPSRPRPALVHRFDLLRGTLNLAVAAQQTARAGRDRCPSPPSRLRAFR